MNTRQGLIRAALCASAALLVAASAAAPTSETRHTPDAKPAPKAGAGSTAGSTTKSLHPNFALLDALSVNVLQSGRTVSTMKT